MCAQHVHSSIAAKPTSYQLLIFTRSRSSLLSFSRFSFSRAGPCRPESPIAILNSGSAKSMNHSQALQHLHDQKSCPHDKFYLQDMQALRYLCMSKHESTIIVSTNLMLHPHPKFVHLCEILKYEIYSIHDSVTVTAQVKEIIIRSGSLHTYADYFSPSISIYQRITVT